MQNNFIRAKAYLPILGLWLYRIVSIALFLAAWHYRSLLPALPISDPDASGYLSPAVHLLTSGSYGCTWRGFPYPLFLTCILWLSPHLEAISWAQHILGLGTAALILLIFLRARFFLPKSEILDWANRLVILVSVAVISFNRSVLTLEQSIRPEALFAFVSAVVILMGIEFSRRALFEKKIDWICSTLGIFFIITTVGAYYVKPAWGLAVGTSLLPLLCAWIRIPGRWKWKLITTATGVILAFLAFVWPSRFLQKQFVENTCGYLSAALLCSHAEFLYDIIEKDALSLPPQSQKRGDLLQFAQEIRNAIQYPSSVRYGLALNPDDIMYRGPMETLLNALQKSGDSFRRFCYSYYFRAWKEHPTAMFGKIVKQMRCFYSPAEKNIYDVNAHPSLAKSYQGSLQSFRKARSDYVAWAPLDAYEKNLEDLDFTKFSALKLPFHEKLALLNEIFLPLLVLSLVGAIIVFLSGNRYSELRPAALCMLYLASFNFANSLTISIVAMMDVDRYHYNQVSMSLVSQGFEVLFLIALVHHYLCLRKQRDFHQSTL